MAAFFIWPAPRENVRVVRVFLLRAGLSQIKAGDPQLRDFYS